MLRKKANEIASLKPTKAPYLIRFCCGAEDTQAHPSEDGDLVESEEGRLQDMPLCPVLPPPRTRHICARALTRPAAVLTVRIVGVILCRAVHASLADLDSPSVSKVCPFPIFSR